MSERAVSSFVLRPSSFSRETIVIRHLKVMNIGFVGVGRMGANMARRLADRGFHVTTLFDVNRATATSLAQELQCAASPTLGDVTAGADVVFTIVTDDAAMREIFGGADNLLANAHGKLFINCATVSPQIHVEIEQLEG